MSEKLKVRTEPTVPKLKMYLLNESDAPKHAPVDPKMRVGSQEQRIAEGKYKATLAKCDRCLGKLNGLSVETTQAGTLTDAIDKAKEFAGRENYISALDTLKKSRFVKLKNDGRSEAKSLIKDAKKKFATVIEKANAITTLLGNPGALFMAETEAAEFRKNVRAQLQPLLQKNATDQDGVDAMDELELLEQKINSLKSGYQVMRTNTVELDKTAFDQLQSITTKLPPETLAPLNERLQNAGTLMAGNEWRRAEEAITAVANDIQLEFDEVTKREKQGEVIAFRDKLVAELDEEEWRDRCKEIPGLNQRLASAVTAGKTLSQAEGTKALYVHPDPAMAGIAKSLVILIEAKTALERNSGKGVKPEQALELLSGMKSSLEEVETRIKLLSNPNFAKAAGLASERVADMAGKVDKALVELKQTLDEIGVDANAVCKPFEDERDLVKRQFAQTLASAKGKDDINPKETIAALLSLSIRIQDQASDDRALDALITRSETDGARDGFAAELKQAQEAVDTLTVMDPQAAEKLRDELTKLETEGNRAIFPAIFDALAYKAGVIAKTASGKVDTTGDWIEGAREKLEKALEVAKPLVEQFSQLVDTKRSFLGIKGDNQEEKYGQLRDFLANSLREQLAAVEVDSLELLLSATDATAKLAGDAKDALDDLKGKKPAGSKGATLGTHAEFLARLKKDLQRSIFASFGGDSATDLIARIDQVATTVTAMPLQDGRKAIVGINTDYKALAAKVAQAQKDYNIWKKDVSAAQDEAKKIGSEGENYRKYIKEQIKLCKDSAHREGGLDNAKLMLTQIRDQIQQVIDDPSVLGQAEQTAKSLAEKKKEDEKVWKSRYELGKGRAREVAGMLTKNRSEIITLVDQANTLFKQTGDFELAMSQLEVAMARADYIEKNPEGLEITRRKNLPAVEAKWREKIGAMKGAFDKLVQDHVLALDQAAVPDDVKAAVKNATAEAGALFNPAEFETAIKALTDTRRSIKDKLAARERALRRVETLLGHFEGNPLLRQLQQNPFDKDSVHAGIASSRFALLDLQNNLLGCMPKNTYG